jgi:glycosyltransferase involved in cell wall biosynthesis
VFDPNSVSSLADALLALDADPELRKAMGHAGRLVVEEFSCEKFARSAILAANIALKRGSRISQDSGAGER